MEYYQEGILKNGKKVIIRNGIKEDAKAFLDHFNRTHIETDFNISYVEESSLTVEDEINYLKRKQESKTDIQLVAIVDGKLVGDANVEIINNRYKLKHRACFGVSVIKDYWGLGIGNILTESCIKIAKQTGYIQLELDVMGENIKAMNLYKKFGFVEFGRNKKGYKSKYTGYQQQVMMVLDLNNE